MAESVYRVTEVIEEIEIAIALQSHHRGSADVESGRRGR